MIIIIISILITAGHKLQLVIHHHCSSITAALITTSHQSQLATHHLPLLVTNNC